MYETLAKSSSLVFCVQAEFHRVQGKCCSQQGDKGRTRSSLCIHVAFVSTLHLIAIGFLCPLQTKLKL